MQLSLPHDEILDTILNKKNTELPISSISILIPFGTNLSLCIGKLTSVKNDIDAKIKRMIDSNNTHCQKATNLTDIFNVD
jgi:hypothetical protein